MTGSGCDFIFFLDVQVGITGGLGLRQSLSTILNLQTRGDETKGVEIVLPVVERVKTTGAGINQLLCRTGIGGVSIHYHPVYFPIKSTEIEFVFPIDAKR
jgi:hypothetical protein